MPKRTQSSSPAPKGKRPSADTVAMSVQRHFSAESSESASNGRCSGPSTRAVRRRRDLTPAAIPTLKRSTTRKHHPAHGSRAKKSPAAKTKGATKVSQKNPSAASHDSVTPKGTSSGRKESSVKKLKTTVDSKDATDSSLSARGKRGRTSKQTDRPSAKKKPARISKEALLCLKCKLKKNEWPYCGITGETHEIGDGTHEDTI